MTATLPNRIAGHLDATPTPVKLPTTQPEREATWTDALFAAVAFLQSRLSGHDAQAAERAAMAILDLEKTRLRHSRKLSGTAESFDAPLKPMLPIDPPEAFYPDNNEDEDEWMDENDNDNDNDGDNDDNDDEEPKLDERIPSKAKLCDPTGRELTAVELDEIARQFDLYILERDRCEAARRKAAEQPEIRIFDFDPVAGDRSVLQSCERDFPTATRADFP